MLILVVHHRVYPVPTHNDAGQHCLLTVTLALVSFDPTQTFVLKMTTRNPDETISITTSVPCAAGSDTDICLAQVRLPSRGTLDWPPGLASLKLGHNLCERFPPHGPSSSYHTL